MSKRLRVKRKKDKIEIYDFCMNTYTKGDILSKMTTRGDFVIFQVLEDNHINILKARDNNNLKLTKIGITWDCLKTKRIEGNEKRIKEMLKRKGVEECQELLERQERVIL